MERDTLVCGNLFPGQQGFPLTTKTKETSSYQEVDLHTFQCLLHLDYIAEFSAATGILQTGFHCTAAELLAAAVTLL